MNKINLYLFNLTSKYIILNTLLISIVILSINTLEISKITDKKNAGIFNFFYLSFLKLPSVISETIPFIIIISIAFLYKNLISNNEFISIRNVGFSILDIFKPVSASILIFGFISLILLNPISANFDKKFNDLTNIDNLDIYTIKFIDEGMWIKNTLNKSDKLFINISKINLDNMHAERIKILKIEKNLINLITASYGDIENNYFKLKDVMISNIYENKYKKFDNYSLKLNFNEQNILDSILNYKFIPFYKYKKHINNLKKFNLYSSEVALFYLSELIKPIFLVIIGFVVMGYSGKFKRNENFFKVLFIAVLIGFLFFLLKEVIINLTIKLNINYFFSYFIIFLTPMIIGLYQMIEIESE